MVEQVSVDVLVAGGGVGGLMAAHRAASTGAKVLLLGGSGGASSRISSMISALGDSEIDTPANLFQDMFRAGGGLNDRALLAALTERIGPETMELAAAGVPFHREGSRLARRRTTGCSWPSSVYSLEMIGVDISRYLLRSIEQARAGSVVRGGILLDLRVSDGTVVGGLAYSPREERWIHITAPAVVLATGGAGQIFGTTTNPRGSKGIGYAMALEAGCELVDMEFISFEPFITTTPGDTKRHDLPTTVLTQGAKLRNGLGEEFLDTANAPTKDVICRAMVTEVAQGRGTPNQSVYYDIREMKPEIVQHYVQIVQAMRASPVAAERGMLEVMPAQHYLMGGVKIDSRAATSVPGLFAVGEVAGGAHGGHRLAGAGGMEVVAGGAIAGESAAAHALEHRASPPPKPCVGRPELLSAGRSRDVAPRRAVAEALNRGCGIFRDADGLSAATDAIRAVLDETRGDPDRAALARSVRVALSIAQSATNRAESRCDHYRTDFPARDDAAWLRHQLVTMTEDGDVAVRLGPAVEGPGGTPAPPAPAASGPKASHRTDKS